MSEFNKFLTSSIGNKLLVAATGLFLILFLVVHLLGNLLLLINEHRGEAFNAYAEILESNLLIKVIAYILYVSILLHAYKGMMIWRKNRKARGGVRYAGKGNTKTSPASKSMMWLGSLIFIFIAIHMGQFWFAFKFTDLEAKNLEYFEVIQLSFSQLWVVIFYVLGMIALSGHLYHGFQSAFQTLGLRRGKYTNIIKLLGQGFAIIVPLLFAIIPIFMYMDFYPFPEFKVIPGQ